MPKSYWVTTFGCQMNAHDSERIKGLLEELGIGEARCQEEADVIVLNTCTIREKPDTRFAAHMGNAAKLKRERPGTIVAVGGCYAEAQRERLFALYPDVDVAFGPGTISHLGEWLGAGGEGVARRAFGTGEERAFAAGLPVRRERRFQAWVQVSMGCNSVCSYCIVPAVRGGPGAAQLVHRAFECVFFDVGEDAAHAFGGEPGRERPADAARRPGDHGNAAI